MVKRVISVCIRSIPTEHQANEQCRLLEGFGSRAFWVEGFKVQGLGPFQRVSGV